MDDASYYQDPPMQILKLMKETFGERFNSYYDGAITSTDYPAAAYPVCVVDTMKSNNTIEDAPTSTDTVGELVQIYFMEESKDDENQSDEVETTKRKLYRKIQGRDPANGKYLPGTALHALRTNLTLKSNDTGFQTTIDHDIDVDYDVLPRPERPTVVMAIITVAVKERIIVDNRM